MTWSEFWNFMHLKIEDWWSSSFSFATPDDTFRSIVNILLYLFSILLVYRVLYIVLGFFKKSKVYDDAQEDKTYAVVISARNEERVIGQLIESIHRQTYDKNKITIFVVADNCTDNTAEVCRKLGAIVYERFDTKNVSKGYALEYLFNRIEEDYSILSFNYYLIFDADNLLDSRFIHEINNAFAYGYDAVTGFRNIKNFDANIISAGYGFHFYRKILTSHRARSILGISTDVTGTGYGVKSIHLKDGWHHVRLTEDTEFTTISVSNGLKIGYCEKAVLYDEQPTDFKTAWKQRVRWSKGRLLNFVHNSPKLIKRTVKKHSFSSYDIYWQMFPYDLVVFLLAFFVQIFSMVYSFATTGNYDMTLFGKYILYLILGGYVGSIGIGILVLIKERKRIHCSFGKKMLYLFTWAWFDMLSIFVTFVAIFKRVKWDPIVHADGRSIEDIENIEKNSLK